MILLPRQFASAMRPEDALERGYPVVAWSSAGGDLAGDAIGGEVPIIGGCCICCTFCYDVEKLIQRLPDPIKKLGFLVSVRLGFLFDTGSDLLVAYELYGSGNVLYFRLCVTFLLLPVTILTIGMWKHWGWKGLVKVVFYVSSNSKLERTFLTAIF